MASYGSVFIAVLKEDRVLHPRHKEWLDQRGNLSGVAEEMGISSAQRDGGHWLAIPYLLDGKIVNRKYRLTSKKQHSMDQGGKLCLWNADVLSGRPEKVVITEGEFDALAVMACGFKAVVSVPNGASSTGSNPLSGNAYAYLYESEAALKDVGQIILAVDGDDAGLMLARDLSGILGPERCRFVTYPEGCKDMNEVLVQHGKAAVVNLLMTAKPYPVIGLYRFEDFPEEVSVRSMDTGISELDELMSIALGSMTVFSGYSNMGKSTVLNTILAHALDVNVPICLASFETMPKPIMRDGLAKALLGCSDDEYHSHPEKPKALAHIEDMVTIISNAHDDDAEIDLEAYLELIRIAVVRDGAKIVILDPWNELEHKRNRDETETDYIGRAIRQLKRFARRFNVSLWVVAHPSKPQKGSVGKPGLYDISGSANWANKADYGLIYHRPDKTKNAGTLTVVKVRMGLPGRCGEIPVSLNSMTSRIQYDQFAANI